jgi:hypothetical protein
MRGMNQLVRLDVLPDVAGHWSVTRDRVLDAEFTGRDRAIDYARGCATRARRAGLLVDLKVHEPLEAMTTK